MSTVPISPLLQIALQRLDTTCRQAERQVSDAKTISDVVRAAHVVVPAELRGLSRSLPVVRSLQQATSRKLEQLVNAQLTKLDELPLEAAKQQAGRWRDQEWSALRGAHGNLFRLADEETRRILYRKTQPAALVPSAATPAHPRPRM